MINSTQKNVNSKLGFTFFNKNFFMITFKNFIKRNKGNGNSLI